MSSSPEPSTVPSGSASGLSGSEEAKEVPVVSAADDEGTTSTSTAAATAGTASTSESSTTAITTVTTTTTPTCCAKEELVELVRAIKFAKPDASQKEVHREITEELSQKYKEQFGFLKDVKLNDVKKVWKKALKQPGISDDGATATHNNTTSQNNGSSTATTQPLHGESSDGNRHPNNNSDLIEKLQQVSNGGPVKIFTVGNASMKHLVQEYTATVAALAQVAIQEQNQAHEELLKNYVHVYLDVPADRSGSRPHQALINFQSNTTTTNNNNNKASSNSGSSKNKKKKDKNHNKRQQQQQDTITASSSSSSSQPQDGSNVAASSNVEVDEIIVKIQMAAPLVNEQDGGMTTKHPMLLYNQNRIYKTFIHPDPNDDSYEQIQQWISKSGVDGALGITGGTKAYFYSRITTTTSTKGNSGQQNIISIRITELAPSQEW